jgi:thioredoxin reductase (NADPH)
MYDIAIIGAGPAGLSASVYASRYGLKNIVIGVIPGGLINDSHEIGNWLGTEKISGFEFAQKVQAHAKSFGAEIKQTMAEKIEKNTDHFTLFLSNKEKIEAKTILLAMGTHRRRLNVPGEEEFSGKGVSYCATCDGFFYREKITAVAGGNDSAAAAALHLAGVAKKVYIVYRGGKLRAEDFWTEAIAKNEKIEIILNNNIIKINGEGKLANIELEKEYNGLKILEVDGLFIEIGSDPSIDLARQLSVEIDETNYIKVDASNKTSVEGVWAAGDITNGSGKLKQIITAAAEGAMAANSVQKYLKANK